MERKQNYIRHFGHVCDISNLMESLYVLKYCDDTQRYFCDQEAAIEAFKISLESDDNMMNYDLMRFDLDEETMEYVEAFEYDLTEFVGSETSASIIIDSDEETI